VLLDKKPGSKADDGSVIPLPAANDPMMRQQFSTHAKFIAEFGPESSGKWLVIYFRWYNTKHPNLAGTWSEGHVVAIG
jgi:hypothetical protein